MMDIDECSCMITKEKGKEQEEVVVAEDLIIEILLLLPPVSVIRFRRVCKSWYSLISNPPDLLFLKHYHHHPQRLLEHHPEDDIFLISTVDGKHILDPDVFPTIRKHPPPPPPPPAAEYVLQTPQTQNKNDQDEQLKVFLNHALSVFIPQKFPSSPPPKLIDSCNGLLLYRVGKNDPISGDGVGEETAQYHVFNPMTKQCFEVPLLLVDHVGNKFKKGSILWLHIVFDPSVSLSFKVVINFRFLLAPNRVGHSGIYVYSSATSSWKYLTYFHYRNYCFYRRFRAVLLDGILYMYKAPFRLLCFDVAQDKIWSLHLHLPGGGAKSEHGLYMLYFGKCGGRLRMIRRYLGDNSYGTRLITWPPYGFYIIELELGFVHEELRIQEYSVKYEYRTDDLIINKYELEDHFPLTTAQIIHIYKTGIDEEALLFWNVDRNTVISYNLTSKTYGKEQKKISDVDHSYGVHAFTYTPTLFPFSC